MTFFYGGEPGQTRGDLILPSSDAGQAYGGIASVIPACPLDKVLIADDVPSALFVAALQRREPLALYEVEPISGIDDVDPGGLANSARSFIGLSVKLCGSARVVTELELEPELIIKIRQIVSTPQHSIPNFAKRLASERRKNNLATLRKGMEINKSDARRAFQKKQRKIHRAAAKKVK
jgi:hypothetical protein